MREVEAIARICWSASEKPSDDYEVHNIIEPDGTYSIFAGDFIIAEDRRVVLLEFSTGMAFDHLRNSSAVSLLSLLGEQTAKLLLSEFGVKVSPNSTARKKGHAAAH